MVTLKLTNESREKRLYSYKNIVYYCFEINNTKHINYKIVFTQQLNKYVIIFLGHELLSVQINFGQKNFVLIGLGS